jgi:hypothetical protein
MPTEREEIEAIAATGRTSAEEDRVAAMRAAKQHGVIMAETVGLYDVPAIILRTEMISAFDQRISEIYESAENA